LRDAAERDAKAGTSFATRADAGMVMAFEIAE
jgi:hypothetical protein